MFTRRPDAVFRLRRHLGLNAFRQQRAHGLAELHRRRKQRRGDAFLERPALQPLGRGARHFFIDHLATDVEQMTVLHTARAGALAVAAAEAAVQMLLRGAGRRLAFQHLLDEVDAASRTVQLIAQTLVGGTGGGAKTAVHTFAQNGFRLLPLRGALIFGGELGLHGVLRGS